MNYHLLQLLLFYWNIILRNKKTLHRLTQIQTDFLSHELYRFSLISGRIIEKYNLVLFKIFFTKFFKFPT